MRRTGFKHLRKFIAALLFLSTCAQPAASLVYSDFLSNDDPLRRSAFRRIPSIGQNEAQTLFIRLSSAAATLEEEPRNRAVTALLALTQKVKSLDGNVCLDWAGRSAKEGDKESSRTHVVLRSIIPACQMSFSEFFRSNNTENHEIRLKTAIIGAFLTLDAIPKSAEPLANVIIEHCRDAYGLRQWSIALRARLPAEDAIETALPEVRTDDGGCPISSGTYFGLQDVELNPRQPVFEVLRSSSDDYEETIVNQANFYDTGRFVRGKYKDSRLVLAVIHSSGEIKVDCADCVIDLDMFQRYAARGDDMVRLDAMSDDSYDVRIQSFVASLPALLGKKALSDAEYSVSSLVRPPPRLRIGESCMTYYSQRSSMPVNVTTTSEKETPFGEVFCSGRELWIARPDGTAAAYYFQPPDTITIGSHEDPYLCRRNLGKDGGTLLDEAYLPAADILSNSVFLTKSDKVGEIYTVKTLSHPFVQEFRQAWIRAYRNDPSPHWGLAPVPRLSDEQYLALHPIILFRGPRKELFACIYQPFVNPSMAEPVIYLYPPSKQSIRIAINPSVHIEAARPTMTDGRWDVIASPDGEIFVSSKTYPYLFWEGRDKVILPPERGDVVARDEVPGYLARALAERGLSTREISDFKAYWLPRMSQTPYYLIAFYGTNDMEFLAPLTINPKPDTLIRLLMDIQPLKEKASVPPGPPPQFIERQGFTVVEWGGVLR